MRISKLKIHNFRSIVDMELSLSQRTVLLGPNNHGKSNVLKALEFALGGAKPDPKDFSTHADEQEGFYVDVTFSDLTDQERITFKKYVIDEKFTIRRGARKNEGDKVETYYAGHLLEPSEFWLKPDKESLKRLTNKEEYEKTPLKSFLTGKPTQESVRKAQEDYIAANHSTLQFSLTIEEPFMGVKSVAAGVLPEFYLIPAVRDLSQESQIKGTTLLGKLMNRAISEMAANDDRFIQIRDQLNTLIGTFNKGNPERPESLAALESSLDQELKNWGVNVELAIIPPQIEKLFELGTDLHIDDGVKTLAEEKGHGLQRAALFALLKAWAKALQKERERFADVGKPRESSNSIIFAIEEPELFLHPHAQRQMTADLRNIAETPGHQVILCSHSPHFIDMEQYKEIILIYKDCKTEPSKKRQCTTDLFEGTEKADHKSRFNMAQWINPDRGEMFFARRVVFVEGATEAVILPFLAKGIGLTWHDVSIIDTGAKHNLPLYIEIAKAFDLDYRVVHDEDPLPDPIPGTWGQNEIESKRRTFQLNEEIVKATNDAGKVFMLKPDLETSAMLSKSKAAKMGKPLAAISQLSNEESFPEILRELAEFVYN